MRVFLAAASIAAACAAQAQATTYKYTSTSSRGLDAEYIYNDQSHKFGLSFTVENSAGVDGAWWVVNNGPSPQGSTKYRYAIFYTDLTNVWAYQYQGGWNRPGNNKGPLLDYWSGSVSTSTQGGESTYSMSLHLADLNKRTDVHDEWVGLAFDTKIGTWLHPTKGTFDDCSNGYIGTNGGLDCFDGRNWIGWDEANRHATVVPLPASLPMLAAPLVAFAFGSWRQRQKAA